MTESTQELHDFMGSIKIALQNQYDFDPASIQVRLTGSVSAPVELVMPWEEGEQITLTASVSVK